ncbi:MAG TPA: response regulator transcription factor [Acidimicrobiales bacterium]|nr:response regulator transcription factor [Acidimicrobiales bacterium]
MAGDDVSGDDPSETEPEVEIDLREPPIRIVLADDSDDLRTMLRTWLEIDGRFVVTGEVSSGEELLELVGEHQPDEVVLDLAMPVVDGFAAIAQIRRASPGTKILVLSAFASPTVRRKAFSLGADAVLVKGVSLEEVEATLVRLREHAAHPS